jgi:uncharacterized protein YlxW (UPF0749 family)
MINEEFKNCMDELEKIQESMNEMDIFINKMERLVMTSELSPKRREQALDLQTKVKMIQAQLEALHDQVAKPKDEVDPLEALKAFNLSLTENLVKQHSEKNS